MPNFITRFQLLCTTAMVAIAGVLQQACAPTPQPTQ